MGEGWGAVRLKWGQEKQVQSALNFPGMCLEEVGVHEEDFQEVWLWFWRGYVVAGQVVRK